ncbi:uncharacterized protein LOC123536342 [Mercenaria mercenaria]|uniref:uncharacterized protein LOC123536342 n=1 Tax=Mercenaria mercenaria TaxID=6596 RepID=UPI00234F981D|nr:uncharacterized protein LOC123536342 [Mercenaria mercenaria]
MTDKKRQIARISGLTIRNCHLYKGKWRPKLGEKLLIACEDPADTSTSGTSVIEVLRTDNGHTVGQAPSALRSDFAQFLTEGGHITAEVTHTKFRSVNNVEEVFCDYILQGPSKAAIGKILNDLQDALQGPELERYSPSMVITEDTYCCYYHHVVSKAPDLEAKCKAMSKYPKRRRTRALQSMDCSSCDPRCSYHEERRLGRKHKTETSSAVTDCVPKHLSQKKSEVANISETETPENATEKETGDQLPDELENDPWTRQIYESAIEQGEEVDYTMRLMIIGCYGQGKSSLAKRLMGQSIDSVESTNGIDVNICEILNEGFKWEQKRNEDAATESIKRLVSIARSSSSVSLESLNTNASDDEREVANMDIDCNETVDLKIKRTSSSFEYKSTNKARADKEKVGEEVGKNEKYSSPSPKKKKTDSVNVKRFSTELRKSVSFEKESINESRKTLSIWDFGGQFVYYATHQLFHSRHAIYLLVFSLNKSLDQVVKDDEKPRTVKPKTMKEYIKFWISSVHSFVGNEHGTEPSIILVGTKKDLLDSDVDIEQKFEEVRKLFEGSKMLFHIHSEHFAVSNIDESNDEIEKLCRAVNYLVGKQCKGNLIPARWILLERKLKENRHLKIINFETVLQFNEENEIAIEDEDQIKLFLQYHHARGTFFYFDDGAESRVVLEPQYIVDAFKCLLTSERYCIVRASLRESWHKLCDKAILDKELLHDVWSRDPQNEFSKFEEVLIFFLQKHRIIAEALKFEGNDNTCSKKYDSHGFYIVPSLLSNPTDGEIDALMKGKKHTQVSLVYIFEHEAVVPTLYYRIAAAGCGRWPLIEFENEPMIFENAVVFKLSVDHAGLLKLHRNTLELIGIGLCPPHRISVDENDLFRRFVEMVISQELKKFRGSCFDKQDQSLYTISVRCYHKHHNLSGSKNVQDLETLKQCNKRRTGCPDNQSHSLKVTKILNEWYKTGLDIRSVPKRTLNKIELSTLSMAFEENWQQLGFQLGFDKAEIEVIDMKRRLTTSMKIFEMLTCWMNREVENATLDVLVRAINRCKRVLKIDKDVLRNLVDDLNN